MSLMLEIPARGETWQLLERLGKGGSAEAWRARRTGRLLSDEVCVKLPLRAYEHDERRAVLEEARVLSRVRHSNVVSLLEVVEDGDHRPVLVLELVRGTDLHQLLATWEREGRWPSPEVAASIGRALCLALGAAQRAIPGGVVHRDVTPHNVLVSREGEVKLTDFGIARVLDRGRWTASGQVKGKLGYVSPEILRDEHCDARSDVFSVGVVLYELLTGRRPFGGRDVLETLSAIARGQRASVPERAAGVPAELLRIVEWMLTHDRRGRPEPDMAAKSLAAFGYEQRATEFLSKSVRRWTGPGIASTRRRAVEERTASG